LHLNECKVTLFVRCNEEMILVTRINGKQFVLNCELIKFMEETPDTVVTLSTGEKLMVKESIRQLIDMTLIYRQKIYREPPHLAAGEN